MFDIEGNLRVVAAMFCKVIYELIALIYELFMAIARVNILSSEEIAPIYQRVTMILTIIMVFYITFEFVKYVVQPDTINDKEKGAGNVALKMIVVILLIAFVPKIFTMAYDLQGRIIDNQVISKIIIGNTSIDGNAGTYGREFSKEVLAVFYKVNEEVCDGCVEADIVKYNLDRLASNGDLKYLKTNLKEYEKVKNPVTNKKEEVPIIDFDGILAIIVGCLIIYILVLYCIDVGTRYAQLIFLQIISPIAIIGYLTPKKDNMFTKWVKQCTTTYIDLFIRIAIIYFILLLCRVLGDAYKTSKLFEGLGEIAPGLKTFTYIALILGLLVFANKAPKMLQELLPSSGAAGIGFGLKGSERIAPMAARTLGAGLGGLNRMVRSGISRGVNTHKRNVENEDKRATKGERREHRQDNRAANRDLKQKRRNLRAVRKTGGNVQAAREELRRARENQVEARSKIAEDKNTRKRSVVGATLAGAVQGGLTGASTGFGAAKLGDIGKKIQEGNKKELEAITAREKYYDAGGTGELARMGTRIQQSMGIQTDSQRTAEEIKRMDSEIKAGETLISNQRASKKSVDSAEDRGKDKAKAGEIKISAAGAIIKTGIGTEVAAIKPGETLSDVALRYSKEAEVAKSALDAAVKSNASQSVIDDLIKKSADADTRASTVLKNVSREAFTRYLQNKVNPSEKPDAVLINHIENIKNDLNVALRDKSTFETLKRRLDSARFNTLIKGEYEKFTFDDIDEIKNILLDISNDKEREISSIKDYKTRIETSSMYDAQKANADGGGKK